MEPQNKLQKTLGISLGLIIVIALVYITVFAEKSLTNSSSDTNTVATSESQNTTLSDSNNQIPQETNINTSTQTKTTIKTNPSKNEDDEGEEEDEDEDNTPINTPVVVQTPPPVDTNKNQTPTQVSSSYKDGTYSAVGTYMSPGGQDQINVTATLSKDIITDITTTIKSADGTSTRYINKFISGYKDLVVGKNIADVNLSKVSGSSLTPKGFNNAIEKIKAEAKA